MPSVKIAALGGGSLYYRRALADIARSPALSGSEVTLYDIDHEKALRMADMGNRLFHRAGVTTVARAADTLADAVDGAAIAISSIGGSGAAISENVYASTYHAADIAIPARYGIRQVVGDTGGPAAMMMALRSLPAYLEIGEEMAKRCPGAVLLNHSNPMAVLCRGMTKYTDVTTIGICHGVQEGIVAAATLLGVPPGELECRWIGTNHYYWFLSLRHNSVDVYPDLMRALSKQAHREGRELSARLSMAHGYAIVYPEDDHIWEFYPFAPSIGKGGTLPYGLERAAEHFGAQPDQAEAAMREDRSPTEGEAETRQRFFTQYQTILDGTPLPERRDDGITGEGLGALIEAIVSGQRRVAIVNIPNRGLIPNLPPEMIVEVEGVTDSSGARGIQVGDAPSALKGILEKRFAWQELVADAAATGSRSIALQAMLVDEMAILPDQAEAMLDELLAASRDLLPRFFPRPAE
jgi:alpha-galactosidase